MLLLIDVDSTMARLTSILLEASRDENKTGFWGRVQVRVDVYNYYLFRIFIERFLALINYFGLGCALCDGVVGVLGAL